MTVVKERKQVLACDPCGKIDRSELRVRKVKCKWRYCRFYLHICDDCFQWFKENAGPYCFNHRGRGVTDV